MQKVELSSKKSIQEATADLRGRLLCGRCQSSTFQCWDVSEGDEYTRSVADNWMLGYSVRCDYFKTTVNSPEKLGLCEAFRVPEKDKKEG